jgi:predicted dehydrogenase
MKIAVFGLGFMGSTHIKALQSVPEAELTAVLSDVPQKLTGDLSSIQGNLGGPGEKFDFSQIAKYRNVPDALADPDIEAVDLCLPTYLHTEVAIQALRAGKHVLVEKPMALTGAAAEQMMEEAHKAGKILMTAQVLRFFPTYRALVSRVHSNELGPVRSMLFRRRCAAPAWSMWLPKKELSGGGVFDLLIHDVDIMLQAFGVPEAVSAVGHEDMLNGIDWIEARFHYPGLDSVIVTGGWHHLKAYPFSMEYTAIFERGTLDYSSAGKLPTLYTAGGVEEELALPDQDGFVEELRYFVNCCAAGRQPVECPPEESAAAVKLTRLMAEARTYKGEKVPCKL